MNKGHSTTSSTEGGVFLVMTKLTFGFVKKVVQSLVNGLHRIDLVTALDTMGI